MSWSIDLPIHSRDEDICDLISATRLLEDPEQRATMRRLTIAAQIDGVRTSGELCDLLEAAGKGGRREIFDDAREAAGLERSQDIDDDEAWKRRQARLAVDAAGGPDAEGKRLQGCAAEGCSVVPSHPTTGQVMAVRDRRWWCEAHRHLAGPDDHRPSDDVARVDARTMQLVPPPSVVAKMQAKDERLAEARRRRLADREAEPAVIREARERYEREHADDAYVNPLVGPGWSPAP
jgi:hypothetical protein